VPEENFWTLRCKGRLTEADTLAIRLGATPSGPSPIFFTGWMPFLPPNEQHQSSKGKCDDSFIKFIFRSSFVFTFVSKYLELSKLAVGLKLIISEFSVNLILKLSTS